MKTPPERSEIAFFGGSFTAINDAYRLSLLRAAQPFVNSGRFGGIRVSTRPDYINRAVLRQLRTYGVTAVELGAQSMDDAVLARNGRGHTAADVERAAGLIREEGFALGLQMMTGLPGDSDAGARETARRLAALRPCTMRIYPTVVMPDTRLADWYRSGEYAPPTLDEAVTLCAALLGFFERGHGIPVIRLGLHAEQEMQERRLAGPWHPAFRELCEGQMYLNTARAVLKQVCPGRVTLRVAPGAVSKMTGHRRRNLDLLAEEGFRAVVREDEVLGPYEVRAE